MTDTKIKTPHNCPNLVRLSSTSFEASNPILWSMNCVFIQSVDNRFFAHRKNTHTKRQTFGKSFSVVNAFWDLLTDNFLPLLGQRFRPQLHFNALFDLNWIYLNKFPIVFWTKINLSNCFSIVSNSKEHSLNQIFEMFSDGINWNTIHII